MSWDDYYKKRYDESREEIQDLHFKMGWIKGSLNRLQMYLDSNTLQADKYTMNILRDTAKAVESAEKGLADYKAELAEKATN